MSSSARVSGSSRADVRIAEHPDGLRRAGPSARSQSAISGRLRGSPEIRRAVRSSVSASDHSCAWYAATPTASRTDRQPRGATTRRPGVRQRLRRIGVQREARPRSDAPPPTSAFGLLRTRSSARTRRSSIDMSRPSGPAAPVAGVVGARSGSRGAGRGLVRGAGAVGTGAGRCTTRPPVRSAAVRPRSIASPGPDAHGGRRAAPAGAVALARPAATDRRGRHRRSPARSSRRGHRAAVTALPARGRPAAGAVRPRAPALRRPDRCAVSAAPGRPPEPRRSAA